MKKNSLSSITEKECFVCKKTLPIDCFYKHPQMADGHVGKCKECNKEHVRENRKKNQQYYITYDRFRYMRPERAADVKKRSAESEKRNVESVRKRRKKYIDSNQEKRAAHNLVNSRLVKEKPSTCSRCGNGGRIHGHHHDYSKPLDVTWLCSRCHGLAHRAIVPEDFKPKGSGGYKKRGNYEKEAER